MNTSNEIGFSPRTDTMCPHCRKMTEHGTHEGCYECGKVKSTLNGRITGQRRESWLRSA